MTMLAKPRALLASPDARRMVMLAAAGFLFAFLLHGGTYVIDAKWRHSGSSWLWAGVSPAYGHHEGSIHLMIAGAGNVPHNWYGIGQQLLYIPFDVLFYNLFPELGPAARALHESAVALTLFPLLLAAGLVSLMGLLRAVGFGPVVAFWSCVLVMVGCSLTAQTSNGLETAEELLYLSAGCWAVVRLCRGPSRLCQGTLLVAVTMAILLRLPHLAYVAGIAGLGWALHRHSSSAARSGIGGTITSANVWRWAAVLVAATIVGLVVDRWFHFARFGEWTGTYIKLAEESTQRPPLNLPEGFYFSFPWQTGLLLQLAGPSKGLLLYEPLLTLCLLCLMAIRWRGGGVWSHRPALRRRQLAVVAAMAAIMLPQLVFYASYVFTFSLGHWGNRFVQAPATIATAVLLARLLELCVGARPRLVWILAPGLVVCSLATPLSTYYPSHVDVFGYKVFDLFSDAKNDSEILYEVRGEHPFAFHLGRRAVMVSHQWTGWPPLARVGAMPPGYLTPNYWPWQARLNIWSGVLSPGVLAALPAVWGFGWMIFIALLGGAAWNDFRRHRRAPAP